MKRVGFIGLGPMGGAICFRLVQHLKKMKAFDVNHDYYQIERIYESLGLQWSVAESCQCVTSVQEVIQNVDILFSCLPSSEVVENVIYESLPFLAEKLLWIDFTTGNQSFTFILGEKLKKYNATLIDAAVSGGPDGASKGSLSVMLGGDNNSIKKILPLIEKIGRPVHVGPTGSGHAVKVINNILNMTHLLGASEGLVALAKLGINPQKALEAINRGSGRSLQTEVRLPKEILSRKFFYNFKLGLMLKDVQLAEKILKVYYPGSCILKQTVKLSKKATDLLGSEVDYTAAVQFIEKESGIRLK